MEHRTEANITKCPKTCSRDTPVQTDTQLMAGTSHTHAGNRSRTRASGGLVNRGSVLSLAAFVVLHRSEMDDGHRGVHLTGTKVTYGTHRAVTKQLKQDHVLARDTTPRTLEIQKCRVRQTARHDRPPSADRNHHNCSEHTIRLTSSMVSHREGDALCPIVHRP